jgi:hypothetical protein
MGNLDALISEVSFLTGENAELRRLVDVKNKLLAIEQKRVESLKMKIHELMKR